MTAVPWVDRREEQTAQHVQRYKGQQACNHKQSCLAEAQSEGRRQPGISKEDRLRPVATSACCVNFILVATELFPASDSF